MAKARSLAVSPSALGQERVDDHRRREGRAGNKASCRRVSRSSTPTTASRKLIDRSIDNLKLEAHGGGVHRRGACLRHLPLPSAFGAGGGSFAAIAVGIAFIVMRWQGLNEHPQPAGIARVCGAALDGVVVPWRLHTAHRGVRAQDQSHADRAGTLVARDRGLGRGRPGASSLLVITLSFLPVFTLEAQEGGCSAAGLHQDVHDGRGRFAPVTLVPVLMGLLVRGKVPHENANPLPGSDAHLPACAGG